MTAKKTVQTRLRSFFLGQDEFHGFGIDEMKQSFDWKIPESIRAVIPDLPVGGGYEANVALKKAMSRRWGVENSPQERERLTRLIIVDWGGIKGNREPRYSEYARAASKEVPEIGFTGIASFSKVLAIRDPDVYAIFDARVAVALNAIHIIGRPDTGELYPYLPGRNNVTGSGTTKRGFSTLPENARRELSRQNPGWARVPRKTAYQSYLALLNSVKSALPDPAPLYDLEMCLFSQAEELARRASPALAQ